MPREKLPPRVTFNMRLDRVLCRCADQKRKPLKLSRAAWIQEAVAEKLLRESPVIDGSPKKGRGK